MILEQLLLLLLDAVICDAVGYIACATCETVRLGTLFAWSIFDDEVELREELGPTRLLSREATSSDYKAYENA